MTNLHKHYSDLLFVFSPSEDIETMDHEIAMRNNDVVSIQISMNPDTVSGRDYTVNECGEDDDGFWVREHGTFSDVERAKLHALGVWAKLDAEGTNQ